MKTFQDTKGDTWTVSINVATIKRVRGLTSIDLMSVLDGKLLETLSSDLIQLCDIVYAVCKPECDLRNVSDEDFGRRMAGDAIAAAWVALTEELADFFPPARRTLLRRALEKLSKLEGMIVAHAIQKMDSGEMEAEIESALKKHGESSGS
jgi:hypothetical protein